MPSNAAFVSRSIKLFRDRTLSPAALSAKLATFAREARDELIQEGRASPAYRTIVDGRVGTSEDSVTPDGKIVYIFNQLGLAAVFALSFCRARSPVDGGDYRSSWFIAVNGRRWTGDLNAIPPDAEVMVTNPLPYARKIDVGHMRMSVPPGIVEAARQAVRRAYPTLQAQRQFVAIPRSLGGGYILKGRARAIAAKQNLKSRAFREGRLYLVARRDTQKGQPMTYPALIITVR